ncbi:MAG: universal stress protein [Fulvivirga sp.]|uniref:universal stress protein n=1 Tax=Fulvivirga sp. TaxID=1931237 RepID=UPI0032EC1BC0
MKTILFPTDFSERANKALDQAIFYAQVFKAKIIIYHTYHRDASNQHSDSKLAVETGIDHKFKKLLKDNEGLATLEHEFHKELGVTYEKIPKFAHDINADLIIMATKGASGFDELWGTKTAAIVKRVAIPILVIPDNTTLKHIKKVGLVSDYSKEVDYHSLDYLLDILKVMNLDIDVITLNRSEKPMNKEEMAYRLLVRKKLESVPSTFHFTFNNNVDKGIIDYSKSNDIGMIAILPRSYGFIETIFHDSLTEKMLFRSPIPLLILKSRKSYE